MPTDMIALLERNDPLSDDAVSTRSPSGVDLRDRIEGRLRKRQGVPVSIPGPALALVAAAVTILVGSVGHRDQEPGRRNRGSADHNNGADCHDHRGRDSADDYPSDNYDDL